GGPEHGQECRGRAARPLPHRADPPAELRMQLKKDWTFLFYNAGQGALTRLAAHSLHDLEQVGSNDQVDLVALNYSEKQGATLSPLAPSLGHAPRGARGSLLDCASPGRLQSPALAHPVASGEAARMSQAETLKATLLETMRRYPSRHFALALTGHG